MKKDPKTTPNKSGKSRIPAGWSAQGLQLPREMTNEFRERAIVVGHGGVKIMGTAAVAVLLALDDETLKTVCNYVRQKTWESPDGLEKERVLQLVKVLTGDNDEVPIVEPIWYVDKIVDQEPPQPPGKKLSDKNTKGLGNGRSAR